MATEKMNVSRTERIVSAALGGVLLARSLTRPSRARWVMAIIGGDLLYRGVKGYSYLYRILGVNTANGSKQREARAEIEHSITVEKPAQELYRFWREPGKVSQILGDLVEITEVNGDRRHWQVRGPFTRGGAWDVQIVEDRPGELLRWQSRGATRLPKEGSVSFRPAPEDWGTEVTLRFRFDRAVRIPSSRTAKLLNMGPKVFAEKVLRRFKSLAETGEVPTLKRNPAARVDALIHTDVRTHADTRTRMEAYSH